MGTYRPALPGRSWIDAAAATSPNWCPRGRDRDGQAGVGGSRIMRSPMGKRLASHAPLLSLLSGRSNASIEATRASARLYTASMARLSLAWMRLRYL